MIICHCRGVTDKQIKKAVREGAKTPQEVCDACGAACHCKTCLPAVEEIIEEEKKLKILTLVDY
jgi:bacterioferritin-associated ferredoxin